MTYEEVQEFLALYEETLTIKEVSNYTGYSVEDIMDIYDEMVDNHILFKIKEKVKSLNRRGGIIRVNPLTFDYKEYEERKDIADDGYIVSNVVAACGKWDSIVSGFFWRYGNDLDFNNIEQSIKTQLPQLYRPVQAENKFTGEKFNFASIISAWISGYNRTEILKAVDRGTLYKHMYWRFI